MTTALSARGASPGQDLASQYQAATGSPRFRSAEVGAWAIANGLWQPSHECRPPNGWSISARSSGSV
jgi:hypothetical protein